MNNDINLLQVNVTMDPDFFVVPCRENTLQLAGEDDVLEKHSLHARHRLLDVSTAKIDYFLYAFHSDRTKHTCTANELNVRFSPNR